jgi:hypothetical protein
VADTDRQRYRRLVDAGPLVGFQVVVEQTDLFIRAEKDLTALAYDLAAAGRQIILDWGRGHPQFFTSLSPLPASTLADPLIATMLEAGRRARVGPMAAVAGALAQYVGRGLTAYSPSAVIVENGGDVFLAGTRPLTAGLFTGRAKKVLPLGLSFAPEALPLGICTSSGTFGHSLSHGRADAATVVAKDAALADAVATALGNRIQKARDIEPALDWAAGVAGVQGAAAAVGDKFGFKGDLELTAL